MKTSSRTKQTVGLTFLFCLAMVLLFGWQVQPTKAGLPNKISIIPAPTVPFVTAASLGEALFNDTSLSNPAGQSCASCHGVESGFKMPVQQVNQRSGIAPGAVKGRVGNRIPPTINYAQYLQQGPPAFAPQFEAFAGGLFWDGHANSLTDQVASPLQNPNEMNNTFHNVGDPAMVVLKVQNGNNAWMVRAVYGNQVFNQSTAAVFSLITQAIVSYESLPALSPFSSKYDAFINGAAKLSKSEMNGLRMVTGSTTGRPGGPANSVNAHCVDCHGIPSYAGDVDLWTNSCFDNIGVPKNPSNPYYAQTNANTDPAGYNPQGAAYVDLGLGGTYYPALGLPPGNIGAGSNGQGDYFGINGTFKAPTLRNVDKRPNPGFIKRYTHNGYFTDLKTIVHFYNTRNLTTHPGEVIDFTQTNPYAHLKGKPLWPSPEYPNSTTLQNSTGAFNSQGAQVGNLGLTDDQENDIVAFLKILTDGYGASYIPVAPAPFANNAPAMAMPAKVGLRLRK